MDTYKEKRSQDPTLWADTFVSFLSDFTCKAPLFPNDGRKTITITDQHTVGEAFKLMLNNRISAIPVLHHRTKNPLYVISLLHLAQYLVTTYQRSDFADSFWNSLQSIFIDKSSRFLNTSIGELHKNTMYTLDPAFVLEDKAPLLDAVQLMVRSETHRVLVLDYTGQIVNIITQSRILELLSTVIDSLPKHNKTIEELGLARKFVATVRETDIAYDAFKIMTSNMVTGLPVIDRKGTLVGSISVSDLKLIGNDATKWNLLSKTVGEYLKKLKSSKSEIRSENLKQLNLDGPTAVRCHSWHSLGFVIRHLAFFKIHRIFIVNQEMQPTGVVTLTDVLKALLTDDYVQMEIAERKKS